MTGASAEHTTIRLHDDLSLQLSREERLRLLIRVMCELVAYGEDDTGESAPEASMARTHEAPTPSR
jgi:hypothetical protein